tara:strand:- start:486 stop:764 length:279 start_codon:yes stop_codon:yes gene_type:complete
MIISSKLPKIDQTISVAISPEETGFKGNLYKILWLNIYVHSRNFYIILIKLDELKNKKIVDARNSKNNIRNIESEIKIENKISPLKLFSRGA